MSKLVQEPESNPKLQKIVLLAFGIGPIIIMIVFLASKGFFDSP